MINYGGKGCTSYVGRTLHIRRAWKWCYILSGCTLRCVFCQNHDIASAKVGKELSVDELSDVMLRLQDNKADNINLVTPTHFTIPIIKAIEKARNKGLRIPVVYNTSAYEMLKH